MANRNNNVNATASASGSTLIKRKSPFEGNFGQFSDQLITKATAAGAGQARHLEQFNRIAKLAAGMEVVARIMIGNDVIQDTRDQGDPGAEQPLGAVAIDSLTGMLAEICGMISDDIEAEASRLEKQVSA